MATKKHVGEKHLRQIKAQVRAQTVKLGFATQGLIAERTGLNGLVVRQILRRLRRNGDVQFAVIAQGKRKVRAYTPAA